MHLLLIYDISLDSERSRLVSTCLDFGLERIQNSAFLGDLSQALFQRLSREIQTSLPEGDFNIQLFRLERDWASRHLVITSTTNSN